MHLSLPRMLDVQKLALPLVDDVKTPKNGLSVIACHALNFSRSCPNQISFNWHYKLRLSCLKQRFNCLKSIRCHCTCRVASIRPERVEMTDSNWPETKLHNDWWRQHNFYTYTFWKTCNETPLFTSERNSHRRSPFTLGHHLSTVGAESEAW